jgi:hypothetical protein
MADSSEAADTGEVLAYLPSLQDVPDLGHELRQLGGWELGFPTISRAVLVVGHPSPIFAGL